MFAVATPARSRSDRIAPADRRLFTLSVKSELVIEAVEVKDKQGNPIHGLTAKDFTLTEDGAPQTIRFCEPQDLSEIAKPLPPEAPRRKCDDLQPPCNTKIAPESMDNERYKDHRLLALYFDMTALPPADEMRALSGRTVHPHADDDRRPGLDHALQRRVGRHPAGLYADRNRLLSILETMVVGEGQGTADSVDDASSADTGAAFGQDDSEFNIFNTDRQLSALQTAAHMLGNVNEKKSLLYFASGLRLNGIDNQAQMHATADAAIKAGVSIWTDRCARPGGSSADGRCDAGLTRRPGNVYRRCSQCGDSQLPAFAGLALLDRCRYRRQGLPR